MAWRVARSLDVLLRQLNERYPNRSKASDGSIGDAAHAASVSDHNPDAAGVVRARDFTHDPAAGLDIDRITDELVASRDPRIKYIIANGLILDSRPGHNPWTWMPYSGANPHRKHFHLSVVANLRADDPRPWDLPCFRTEEDDMNDVQNAALIDIRAQLVGTPELGKYPGWDTDDGKLTVVDMLRGLISRQRTIEDKLDALKTALPGMVAEEVRTALAESKQA